MFKLIQRKALLPAAHDIFMAGLSLYISLYIRMGEDMAKITPYWREGVALFTVISAAVFLSMRLYKSLWRYTSLKDLVDIVKAVSVALLAFLLILFVFIRLDGMPRSTVLIDWFVLIALLTAPRLAFRYFSEGNLHLEWKDPASYRRIPVLLIGWNEQAEHFLREMEHARAADYRVVGIVQSEKANDGRRIRGIPVYGNYEALPVILKKLQRKDSAPQKLLITQGAVEGELLRSLVGTAEDFGISAAMLPKITDFKGTDEAKFELKPVQVEDLLGRSQKSLDMRAVHNLVKGSRVLITGAGGTIGSELVRQVAALHPLKIVLAELSEHNLYQIDMELSRDFPGIQRRAALIDVKNKQSLETLFEDEKPEVVFHAAALKHVPLAEINAGETVLTNVFGSKYVADLALVHNAKAMVMISTDKAVNPSSIMGATKRIAEKYCQSLGQMTGPAKTKFVTVRFGNVLGSSGSVIPLFEKQLKAGGPITVTHQEMTRYFMTVREAVELVLQASALAVGQEDRSMIYVLDMGEPVRIVDLATQMIRLAGLKPHEDVKIEFIGLRPGEKLYEELFYKEEAPAPTATEGVMLAAARKVTFVEVDNYLRKLLKSIERNDSKGLLQGIRQIVPEYMA